MDTKLPIATFIILKKGKKIFCIKRMNTGHNDGKWTIPAGRLQAGESLRQSVIREAKEEAGVDIDKTDLSQPLFMDHHDETGERLHVFFLAEKWDNEPINNEPDKCGEIGWHDLDSLPADFIENVKCAIESMRKGEQYIEFGF